MGDESGRHVHMHVSGVGAWMFGGWGGGEGSELILPIPVCLPSFCTFLGGSCLFGGILCNFNFSHLAYVPPSHKCHIPPVLPHC